MAGHVPIVGTVSSSKRTSALALWTPPEYVPCMDQPEIFFRPDRPKGRRPTQDITDEVDAAKICRTRCPVQDRCLEEAMLEEGRASAHYRHGVRGGLNPDQRIALDISRRKKKA